MEPTRVLLVDDDLTLLQALPETIRLRMPGVEVDTAENAADALARMAAGDYDAVISDIKMPGMDGLAMLAHVQQLRPDVPTLLVTGHGEHDLAVQALRGGAYDFIQKPIDREYFIASLARAVQVRQLRREVERQRRQLEQYAERLESRVEEQTGALRLLVDATRVFADSFDSGATLNSLVRLSVPRIGEWCVGVLLADDGALARMEVAHTDPQREAVLRRHVAQISEGPDPAIGPWGVDLRNATSLLIPEITEEWIRASGISEHYVELVRRLDVRSAMVVPLVARGRVSGTVAFATSTHRYTSSDLAFAEALCRRAALAIDNARLYERERTIAETLQRSLLPESLPELPGVESAARYEPATPEAVGGDWYDLFRLPGGRVGLVMGDVAGRGVRVAAVMGQLRNALRAYALEGYPPEVVVGRLGSLVEPSDMATVFYCVLDAGTWVIEFANAGHLPPLLVDPHGETRFLDGGSPPLSGLRHHVYQRQTVHIEPGSTMLLYTDGLVERRGVSIDDGLDRLRRAVADYGGVPGLETLVDRVLTEVTQDVPQADDIAVLAVRASVLDGRRLAIRLPAEPSSVPTVRHALRRWLEQNGVPARQIYEITVACCEACSNTVEHAYGLTGGLVEILGAVEEGNVTITVQDQGRWRAARGVNRGRGLALIEALTDGVAIEPTPQGTAVHIHRLIRQPVEA